MKALLFGPGGVGKTTLMKAVTSGYDFLRVINLPPTRGISREGYLFRGLLELSIWDAGGQSHYMEHYFSEGQRNRIFADVKIAIFMVDSCDFNPAQHELFESFLKNIKEFSPDIKKIFVLMNKTDLPNSDRDKIYQVLVTGLDETLFKMCAFSPVSVKNNTAQQRLIEILDEALQNSTLEMQKLLSIRKVLDDFKSKTNAEFFLFNRPDGLMITSTMGKIEADPLNFLSLSMGSLESNVEAILLKIWERVGKVQELVTLSMVVYEGENNYVIVREIDDFTILMILTNDKNPDNFGSLIKNLQFSTDQLNSIKSIIGRN